MAKSESPEQAYVTWTDDKSRAVALYEAAEAYKQVEPIMRTTGSDIFFNVAPNNTSVRDGFGRRDYESFRPGEANPITHKERIGACMSAYKHCPIVRNVIDLMSDFAVQGMDIVHQNERIERFHKEWFRRVNAVERSERFLNYLYRTANNIVKRHTATITVEDEDRLRKAVAAPDIEMDIKPVVSQREIPWRYSFLNPLTVDALAGDLAPFVGPEAFVYGVRLPDALRRLIKSPKTDEEKAAVKLLPEDVRRQVKQGSKFLVLDKSKISVFHYKRDDWETWADPMVAPLLKDLSMLEKMKLADLAALDGAISSIRVWKLGSLEHKIMPTPSTILRLAEMLNNNVGGGVMDLVWGPDIDLKETSTDVYRFLGETKYSPVLNAIFQGLGIPPTLTGTPPPGGFTNNYISLKTLVERLEYGRSMLRAFWEQELRLLQLAMGFRFPARIVFDRLLTDEAAEKQLILHLWDRNIVSDEYVQEIFKAVPEIEAVRLRREAKKRKEGQMSPKASPFHDPHHHEALEKIFAQSGAYAPSQFGLELDDRKGGETSQLELAAKLAPKPAPPAAGTKPKGQPGQGRPKNKKDGDKRKKKTVKPRTSAEFVENVAWAEEAQAKIAKLTSPVYLKALGKNTLRDLTEQESRHFESFKFAALCQIPFGGEINEEVVAAVLAAPLTIPAFADRLLKETVSKYVSKNGREPSFEVCRRFQASVYSLYEESRCAGDSLS